MGVEPGAVLVYDGDCSFCSAAARWIASRWNGAAAAVAWQRLDPEQLAGLGLTPAEVRQAAWWIDAAGHRSRGHLAIGWALRAARGRPALAGRVLLVPPCRWLAALSYLLIARWRHLLPGGTAACRV